MSRHQQLVSHATDAGADNRRKVFGLTGNNYLYVVGGGLATMLTVHLAFNVGLAGGDYITGVIASLAPLAASMAYVYGFLEGRNPYYQEDVFDRYLNGGDFNVIPRKAPRNPVRGVSLQESRKRLRFLRPR